MELQGMLPADDRGGAGPREPDQRVAAMNVAVVGAGTMAVGVALAFARADRPVTLVARSPASATRSGQALDDWTARMMAPRDRRSAIRSQVTSTARREALSTADLVVECVTEDLAVKQEVFADLDRRCPASAVLATTTSSLRVADIAAATAREPSVIGLHFFNPAPVMAVVELVATEGTGAPARRRAGEVMAALGKTGVWCGDRAGFIVNRLLVPWLNDAIAQVCAGVEADALDAVMTGTHGFPMGPVALVDLIGTDVVLAIARSLAEAFDEPGLSPVPLLAEAVRENVLGTKNGTSVGDLIGAGSWSK